MLINRELAQKGRRKIAAEMIYNLFPLISVFIMLGFSGCGTTVRIKLDPDSRNFYETARLIMSKQERKIFNHLPDKESREEFIEDFWAKRDPDPDTEENKFKEEFFRRIEYANKRFREGPSGWKTDRGRIYIYLGYPDKIDETFTHGIPEIKGSILWWIYYGYDLGIRFVDKRGLGHFTFDPYSGIYGDLFEAIERAKFGFISEEGGMAKKFVDFDVEYNKENKEFVVAIPVTSLIFKEEEDLLKSDFEFEFYIYEEKGLKRDKFKEIKSFEMPEDEVLRMKEIEFTFPYDLNPGKYLVDVVIIGKPDSGKARKIFKIKV